METDNNPLDESLDAGADTDVIVDVDELVATLADLQRRVERLEQQERER